MSYTIFKTLFAMPFVPALMRLAVLLLLTAGVALAQQESSSSLSLSELLREDGSLDLHGSFKGAVDLSGFEVTMGDDGTLRARAVGDGQWLPGQQATGVNSGIGVLAWGPDGLLYVGGAFTSAGGVPGTSHIARWKPSGEGDRGGTWSALGSGVDANVRALAWGADGALYVGGNFTSAGGAPGTSHIARWTPEGTGGTWSALGVGLNGPTAALVWDPEGVLYVGGNFTSAGEVSGLNRIAQWTPNGTDGTWSALGSGMNNTVWTLTWGSDGALYAGGNFTSAGGAPGTSHIARWTPDDTDGAWSALGSGVNDYIADMVWGPDGALYVGGDFTSAGGVPGTRHIARWTPDDTDGTWSSLGSNLNSTVTALAWGPDDALYVGGYFIFAGGGSSANHIARWTPDGMGGTWSALGASLNNPASALAWSPNETLYVGGSFTSAGGAVGADFIARWTPATGTDGTWSALALGLNGLVSALAWGPDGALYVGGDFTSAGGIPGTSRIARWTPKGTGGAWSALGSGVNDSVLALGWGADGALYVGGRFTLAGGVQGTRYIAKWMPDGADGGWKPLISGVSGTVWALAWGPDDALYVGGEFGSASGVPALAIARWTPEDLSGAWSALGSGAFGPVLALTWGPDGALYVGGQFIAAGMVADTDRIARWTPDGEGGEWSALGTGVNSAVRALSWGPDGALYVGGYFDSASGVPGTSRIARWTPDGTGGAWSALGAGTGVGVNALAWGADGALYVGGSFASVGGGVPANRVARWTPNGTGGAWSALDSGLNDHVRALAWGEDNVLYVGGEFTSAGSTPSAHFARWAANTTTTEPQTPRSASLVFEAVYPNPFTTRTTLVFSVTTPADVHLAVYDVLGRRVATLAEEHVGAGTHERLFDAAGLPNGTYLVRLSSGGTSQTRRVLLLR